MKWILISSLVLLSGCRTSSFYAPAGATSGAVVGSFGGPVTAGGGALIGWGIGKGAQVIDENKELKESIKAISEGDVESIAKIALEKGMKSQDGKLQEFISYIEKILIITATGLVLYLFIPIFIARKTASSCAKSEAIKNATRPPFPVKPPSK